MWPSLISLSVTPGLYFFCAATMAGAASTNAAPAVAKLRRWIFVMSFLPSPSRSWDCCPGKCHPSRPPGKAGNGSFLLCKPDAAAPRRSRSSPLARVGRNLTAAAYEDEIALPQTVIAGAPAERCDVEEVELFVKEPISSGILGFAICWKKDTSVRTTSTAGSKAFAGQGNHFMPLQVELSRCDPLASALRRTVDRVSVST